MSTDIKSRALELAPAFVQIRRELHQIPETALEEFETSAYIKRKLQEFGLKPEAIGDSTGVTAMITGNRPGPVIALRSDMDGLPVCEASGLSFASGHEGKCHACGHDLHMAIVLLAARLLEERKDSLAGSVKVIFQPAEEGQKGARLLMKYGILENPRVDMILGMHTMPELEAGKVGIRHGAIMAASDRVYLQINGKGGHGAHPQECIDPILAAVHVIDALQTIVSRELDSSDSAVLSICSIHGGSTANVIPDTVKLAGTIRTLNPMTRSWIRERIRVKAQAAAAIEGASADVSFHLGAPPVISSPRILDRVKNAAEEILGSENVEELFACDMCGEDFAGYLEEVPGVFFRVGTADEDPRSRRPLHSADIRFDEQAIVTAAMVLAQAVMEILQD